MKEAIEGSQVHAEHLNNEGMTWVIPMAGKGTRTQSLGEFKPFIEIKGHTILSWFMSSVKSLVQPEDRFVLITTKAFAEKFNFEERADKIFKYHEINNPLHFVKTEHAPQGTTATILEAEKLLKVDQPVMIINPDQYIDFDMPQEIDANTGYLGLYLCFHNSTGYVDIQDGKVQRFVERQRISNIASGGVFISSNGNDLVDAMRRQIQEGETVNGEYFIGPCFNYLIQKGYSVYPIPIKCKYDLGNPTAIEAFSKRNYFCK